MKLHPRPVHHAFTLVELLVVVAIIMILLSMLLPGLGKVKMHARQSTCMANLRALMIGYQGYCRENTNQLMGANTGAAHDWMGDGNSVNAIEKGKMWKFIQDHDTYRCPDQVYPSYLNTYSINGRLNGEQKEAGKVSSTKNWTKLRWTADMDPDRQMVIIEEDDDRGWNRNSFMLGVPQGKFVDLVPANHNGGDNLAFLDGHVDTFTWKDSDSLIRPKHDPEPTFGFNDPGNVDWDQLNEVFMTWPR